jgi:hypothetical protein
MNCQLFKPLEFEGIRTGYRQCTSNCGEFAIISSAGVTSKPVEFDGFSMAIRQMQTLTASSALRQLEPPKGRKE